MYSLKTIEWFGIQSASDQTNAAPAQTGSWIKLMYHLPRRDPLHPRFWRRASQQLRVVRPDLWGGVQKLNERQAERALANLLDQHSRALGLPVIVVAERELVTPSQQHWVALYESRTFSHALTTFAVLAKTSEGLCSTRRPPYLSVLYAPRRVEKRDHRESVWEVALWLNHGYADLLTCALRSPANTVTLEALL